MNDAIETELSQRAERGQPKGAERVLAVARERARHLQGRRRRAATALIALAAVAVSVGLAQLVGDSDKAGLIVTGPNVFQRLTGGPERVVALTESGDVVELSTVDSSVRRILASVGSPLEGWSAPELAPDGSVWVGIGGKVLRVDTSTGAATLVAEGMQPRISPDGRYLAYGATDPGYPCASSTLVVRDLQTGSEQTWRRKPGSNVDFLRCLYSLSWAPDGSLITFTLGWENARVAFVIDPRADRSLALDGRRVGPPVGSDTNWWNPTFLAGADTVVVQEMVPVNSDGGYGPGRVLRVDLSTGTALEAPDLAGHLQVVAYDAVEGHALILEDSGSGHHQLVHRDSAANRAVLAVDILGADW